MNIVQFSSVNLLYCTALHQHDERNEERTVLRNYLSINSSRVQIIFRLLSTAHQQSAEHCTCDDAKQLSINTYCKGFICCIKEGSRSSRSTIDYDDDDCACTLVVSYLLSVIFALSTAAAAFVAHE